MRSRFTFCLSAVLLFACASERGRDRPDAADSGGDASEFSCAPPSSIVQDVTCAVPDQICPGSCREGFAGVKAVGSIMCRCMDVGSGFGAQWICETATCDADAGTADAGTADAGTADAPPMDGSSSCPPFTFEPPSEPGCTTRQYDEIRAFTTPAEVQAYLEQPANAACNDCLVTELLACATELSCAQPAGNFLCCLNDTCGADMDCRTAALEGECRAEADAFTACLDTEPSCDWEIDSPPRVCFP